MASVPAVVTVDDQDLPQRAMALWLQTGKSRLASEALGGAVSESQIRTWRIERPDLWRIAVEEHRKAMRDLRRSIARDAVGALKSSVSRCALLAREGELDARDASAIARVMARVVEILDNMERLDSGLPTEILEDRRTDAELIRDVRYALQDPELIAVIGVRGGIGS